jgi:flavin-dependent dehydrogenase
VLDLVVVGGGPVGLASALYAHRAGLSVCVLEPRPGPADKACGEGLMPSAVRALGDLGVDPPGHPLQGIAYIRGGATAAARFRSGPGRGVRRTALHAALLTATHEAGIPVAGHRVTALGQDGAAVTAGPVRAGYAVAADGLHSPLRRLLGLQAAPRGPVRFGLRQHVRATPWSDGVEVHWGRESEAYVTPVAEDLVGIAVLTRRRGPLTERLAEFPALAARVRRSPASDVLGAGPLRQRSRRRVAGRVLLVGDASGYVDALTGEGIALGLSQARAAVAAIVAGQPGRYERDWLRLTAPHSVMTQALLQATRVPGARAAVVPAAAALPRLFAAAVDRLGG